MPSKAKLRYKFPLLLFLAFLNVSVFFLSLRFNYKWELAREHVRFRKGFPSQANWIPSPFGRLKSYLFNVTNAEEFLNGTDSRMKIKEVGPITYSIVGFNEIFEQNDTTLTYKKIRYHMTKFEPEESGAPDILNQTIILPNLILLGAAAKLHDWIFPIRHVFNSLTINEDIFLKNTVNYFLWDFQIPALNVLSSYVPNIVSNCGMLYNALRPKEEVYSVKIGLKEGLENFFKIEAMNNRTIFKEHRDKEPLLQKIKKQNSSIECPVDVRGSFDNSLFPPLLSKTDELSIVAAESCRTLKLNYQESVKQGAFKGYRYTFGGMSDKPTCLEKSMGIPLHKGMFDVSKCLFNEVPSAFSGPQFYGSTYNWSEHYEGFSPNAKDHEAYIILEPTTGIPIEEKYRFQSNIPMPDLKGYRKDLEKFSNVVVPSFWYEYDMDELPLLIQLLIATSVYAMPELQGVVLVISLILGLYFSLKSYLLWKRSRETLETTFEVTSNQNRGDLAEISK